MDVTPQGLRRSVQVFVRRFGLLAPDRTPCGTRLGLSHAHALMALQDGPRRQKELVAELVLDKSNVARLCARMLNDRHIKLVDDPTDGRARVLCLTAKGRRLAQRIDAESLARFTSVLGSIPKRDRRAVLSALSLLNSALGQLAVKEIAVEEIAGVGR